SLQWGVATIAYQAQQLQYLRIPFFPQPCNSLHPRRFEPAFFAKNRALWHATTLATGTWTAKMGRNRGSERKNRGGKAPPGCATPEGLRFRLPPGKPSPGGYLQAGICAPYRALSYSK